MNRPPLTHAARVADWLYEKALPLWAGVGLDPSGAGAWEALDHAARPLVRRDKRLRVMPRQAFVFARASHRSPAYLSSARSLFDFAMTRGTDPGTGNLAALLAPDGTILQAPHDLYDLAFMHLAAAALTEAGVDVAADLARLDAALDRLAAPRGWHEAADRRLPRRQNPHMHLFEAATELYRVTGAPRYRAIADTCLDLFATAFLQSDGRVLEYFGPDWAPVQHDQAIEPGHLAEWIWLLDRFETVTGQDTGIDPTPIFARMARGRDAGGLLLDRAEPASDTRRLWPQTEFLKAGLVLRARGQALPRGTEPDTVLERLFAGYLDTPVAGGWYDKRQTGGKLLSQDMPASSFYHIYVAFDAYLAAARSAPADP